MESMTLLQMLPKPLFNIFEYCTIYVLDFPGDAEVLIGMDIIRMGDFAVCNADKKTSFSFVIPPFPDRINLAEKAETVNKFNFSENRA